jgi:ketosteroid isomerase-like protein
VTRPTVRLAVILAGALVVGALGVQAVSAQTADERALRETDLAWAKAGAAKDLEATLSFLADDATEMPPNAPAASGKQALRRVWGGYFATPGFAMSWQPTKVEVARSGEIGYSIGTYQQTMHDKAGKPVTDRGKYVTIWKKQPDGKWKAVVDTFNSDLPLPAAH